MHMHMPMPMLLLMLAANMKKEKERGVSRRSLGATLHPLEAAESLCPLGIPAPIPWRWQHRSSKPSSLKKQRRRKTPKTRKMWLIRPSRNLEIHHGDRVLGTAHLQEVPPRQQPCHWLRQRRSPVWRAHRLTQVSMMWGVTVTNSRKTTNMMRWPLAAGEYPTDLAGRSRHPARRGAELQVRHSR